MPKLVRFTFLIHTVVAVVIGALLLIIPGRFLGWVGWGTVDPHITRLLGAALLALGWSSFRGWRASDGRQVAILVEMEAAFTILGSVGLLRHLLFWWYPPIAWITFAVLAVFAVAWVAGFFALRRK